MTIEWNDSFSIGNQLIDHQHQQLFKIANHFLKAATKDAQLRCADDLFDYTRNHFSYEEQLMRQIEYPEYEQHVRAHGVLISRLNSMNEGILNETLDKNSLEEFIKHWALYHIPTTDAKLAEYMNNSSTREGELT